MAMILRRGKAVALFLAIATALAAVAVAPIVPITLNAATAASPAPTATPKPEFKPVFGDVSPTDAYYDAIMYAYSRGLMSGKDGKFMPNEVLTWADALPILQKTKDLIFDCWKSASKKEKDRPVVAAGGELKAAVTLRQFTKTLWRGWTADPYDNSAWDIPCTRAMAANVLWWYLRNTLDISTTNPYTPLISRLPSFAKPAKRRFWSLFGLD